MRSAGRAVAQRRAERGLSLVELMVALTVGLVVSAAALAAVYAMSASGRHAAAHAEVSDNASAAMLLLREHLALAGYAEARARDANGRFLRDPAGPTVFACEHGFVNPRAPFAALSCVAGRGSAAIAVVHEADAANALMSSDGLPLDCLGNGIPASSVPSDGRVHHLADTRFYLSSNAAGRKELYCKDAGAAAAQPVVEGIEELDLDIALASGSGLIWRRAGQVAAGDWPGVTAIRVCLVATSMREVLDRPMPYVGCDGAERTAPDRRLYRSATTTVMLHNSRPGAAP